MRKTLVGVMGPGEAASPTDCERAYELGQAIARHSWVLVTGGRDAGVMDAALRGARDAGGLTVGILPSSDLIGASSFVDIPIVTGLGQARNNVNVLSCQLIFACGMGPGTASEVSLALKARRHVVLVNPRDESVAFFAALDPGIHVARDTADAVRLAEDLLG
ncbi:MAG TPA: hypothetical protein VH497_07505 [Vicinamibacterales bacterium]|jgi:hypothetical protein